MKLSIASLLTLVTLNISAQTFTGEALIPKKLKKESLDSLSMKGIKYEAIKKAIVACKKTSKLCSIKSVEINNEKAIAVLESADRIGKDRVGFTFKSGDFTKNSKFSKLENYGVIMKTLETGLKRCEDYQAVACIVNTTKITLNNDSYFDIEWRENAFKSAAEINISIIQ